MSGKPLNFNEKNVFPRNFLKRECDKIAFHFIFIFFFWLFIWVFLNFFYTSQHQSKFVWKAASWHARMCKRWRYRDFSLEKYHSWWFVQQKYNQLNSPRRIMNHEKLNNLKFHLMCSTKKKTSKSSFDDLKLNLLCENWPQTKMLIFYKVNCYLLWYFLTIYSMKWMVFSKVGTFKTNIG